VRVLQLLDTEGFAGTEKHVLELANGLRKTGDVEVHLACKNDSPLVREAQLRDIDATPCWSENSIPAIAAGVLEVRSLALRIGAQIIHAHNGRTMLTAALVSYGSEMSAIATQHFISPQFTTYRGPHKMVAQWAHDWVNQRLSHVICVSDAARRAMLKREHIDESKVTTVLNGIVGLSVPDPQEVNSVRRSLGSSPCSPLIICVSRLAPEKGLECLLKAVSLLRDDYPGIRLVLAGDGPSRESLEQFVAAEELATVVSFLGFRSDVASLIGAADVFVLPSPAEPFGLSILEAMSLGKPIIACAAGGPAEILTHGVDALLCTPSNNEALADAIKTLWSNDTLQLKLGANARLTFLTKFHCNRMAEEVRAIYGRVLNAPPC
jgi:glycosyltransferase involved in cell wall biosynthesis